MFSKLRKGISAIGAASLALFVTTTAQAGGTYDTLTGAVDWSEVSTAVVAVGALIAAVYVVIKGAKMVLRAIRSA